MPENVFSEEEHAEIRRSDDVRLALAKIALDFGTQADTLAGDPGGYGMDMVIGTDRARAHVWPKSKKAQRAEAKNAHLLTIVANNGGTNT